jgi:hypothetical protein
MSFTFLTRRTLSKHELVAAICRRRATAHQIDGRPAGTTGEVPRVRLWWDVALFLAVYHPELVRALTFLEGIREIGGFATSWQHSERLVHE